MKPSIETETCIKENKKANSKVHEHEERRLENIGRHDANKEEFEPRMGQNYNQ